MLRYEAPESDVTGTIEIVMTLQYKAYLNDNV